jgi:LuxR family transcriptional regulator, positive regulator of biofilm formation
MSLNMTTYKNKQKTSIDSTTTVYIVGNNQLQNELLRSFLESQDGYACASKTEFETEILEHISNDGHIILLFDSYSMFVHLLNKNNQLGLEIRQGRCHPILFNIEENQGIEKKAIYCGIRGAFYNNEPKDNIIKGLSAVLNGELWFPRKVISDYILTERNKCIEDDCVFFKITLRERQVLIELSKGASNQEIAENLFISMHTVKTHIYNCYRKIGVSNRMQATAWTLRNL